MDLSLDEGKKMLRNRLLEYALNISNAAIENDYVQEEKLLILPDIINILRDTAYF